MKKIAIILLALVFPLLNVLYFLTPNQQIIAGYNSELLTGYPDWQVFIFQTGQYLAYAIIAVYLAFKIPSNQSYITNLVLLEWLTFSVYYFIKSVTPSNVIAKGDYLSFFAISVASSTVILIIINRKHISWFERSQKLSQQNETLAQEKQKALHELQKLRKDHQNKARDIAVNMVNITALAEALQFDNWKRVREVIKEEVEAGNESLIELLNSHSHGK